MGWYVEPEHQPRGVGRALIDAAEDWARSQDCTEIASDTWIDNEPSRAHTRLSASRSRTDACITARRSA